MSKEASGAVLTIAGTRPEVLKLAPVVKALRRRGVPLLVASTGQQRDLLSLAFASSGVEPDLHLDALRDGQPLHALLARLIGSIGGVLEERAPRAVIVQGDTASAFAGATAGFLHRARVYHVEAGLRTGQLDQPFPEEAFRQLVSRLAEVHFAPTAGSRDNLLREGVPPERIHVTGNTVVDALSQRPLPAAPDSPALRDLPHGLRTVFLTIHRRENHPHLASLFAQAIGLLERHPSLAFVCTEHPNPAVAAAVQEMHAAVPRFGGRLRVVPPLGYSDVLWLLSRVWLVATDSGGLQEEAPSFQRPVVVLRAVTERPEGVELGIAMLAGADLTAGVEAALAGRFGWKPGTMNPYGDGRAAERIASIIARDFTGMDSRSPTVPHAAG
jgi:UDP-N-acetylglucosamine 2-epimerase (non-hydrolysing)